MTLKYFCKIVELGVSASLSYLPSSGVMKKGYFSSHFGSHFLDHWWACHMVEVGGMWWSKQLIS
jgi:hypothetical protein